MCVFETQTNALGLSPENPNSVGNPPLKIIYISHLHPPPGANTQNIGGMQTVSSQLLSHLSQRSDLSVYPLLLESPWQGTERRTLRFLLRLYRTLPALIQREQADVLLFASMVTASLAVLLEPRVSIPMVTINHGQDVTISGLLYQQWVPKIFHHLQGVISVSSATQAASIERGLDPAKSFVLPNGINIQPRPYHPERSRQFIQAEFNLNLEGKYLLLSVGRQVQRKGHAWFIAEVLPKIQHPVIYLLIGQGKEFKRLHGLRAQAQHPEQIVLAGKTSRALLQQAYDAADLFIMPNIPVRGDMEGFGVVILEANEARTPVIASDLEGIKDVVQNGINGYKVPPLNPSLFAKTIDEVLGNKFSFLCESAYEWVTQHCGWPSVCEQYVQVLQKVRESHQS
ncbi:MAG: glycosyltransferase family 4 protein [Acaryochloris sp. RU_4_1]|nr:glycosyltransferase family 4 protein [Acaryochloris sp. SU_5_25]NJM65599.1 glycosyltransferase family 4 protein [Acaryochloris sp. RU_4_1]NJR54365.1 glycosyltransferase family 4 protein [Acaryochloris sp. CRU_2_0]